MIDKTEDTRRKEINNVIRKIDENLSQNKLTCTEISIEKLHERLRVLTEKYNKHLQELKNDNIDEKQCRDWLYEEQKEIGHTFSLLKDFRNERKDEIKRIILNSPEKTDLELAHELNLTSTTVHFIHAGKIWR